MYFIKACRVARKNRSTWWVAGKKKPALQAGIELAGTLKIRWLTSWDFFLLEFVIKTLVLARKISRCLMYT